MPRPRRWDRGSRWRGQAVKQEVNAAARSRPAGPAAAALPEILLEMQVLRGPAESET